VREACPDRSEDSVESEAKEPAGVTRGQNAVHVMPPDWSAAERVLATLIDRIDPSRAETQLLVVTPDAESAAVAADAVVHAVDARPIAVVAATASPRAARLLKGSAAHVVIGAPTELVALLQSSALKPESVRGLVFAWLDSIVDTPDAAPLETLMGELPKEGARVVLTGELTAPLEALIERYARRARRAPEGADAATAQPVNVEYVAAAATARRVTLRRLLDALDLPRAVLYARSESARAEASRVARALGYPADSVRVSATADEPSADPLVLVELPASREELRALVGTAPRRVYAVVQPSQLAGLRSLLGGGTATPVALLEAAERARGKDAALRSSLRDVLTSGDVRREVLALEPLLAEFDGIEIAAAALRLLEQQRPARPAATAAQTQPMQRLFVNLGEKDGIRTAEIVAAITTEAGIPGSQVGKVEVRDTHAIVEVGASVAELVASKLTGSVVRGRRVQARLDTPREDRPARAHRQEAGAGVQVASGRALRGTLPRIQPRRTDGGSGTGRLAGADRACAARRNTGRGDRRGAVSPGRHRRTRDGPRRQRAAGDPGRHRHRLSGRAVRADAPATRGSRTGGQAARHLRDLRQSGEPQPAVDRRPAGPLRFADDHGGRRRELRGAMPQLPFRAAPGRGPGETAVNGEW
jgi:ATP-dependent RNA helicase DeaD